MNESTRGFNAAEVIIVILMVGMLTMVSLPNFARAKGKSHSCAWTASSHTSIAHHKASPTGKLAKAY